MKAQRRPNKYWATAIPGLACRIFALVLVCMLVPSSTLATGVEIKPGDLDPTFGEGGKVTTDFFGKDEGISKIALQPNGKIVAVGGSGGDFALARYNRDGSLDTSFGDGGKVTTDFFGERDEARAIAIQPNGKIVVVGFARSNDSPDFALARYNRDGSLDESFGHSGKVTTDFFGEFDEAFDVALLPNGKIVVVGAARGSNTASVDFALARYNRDGSLDTTFGDDGKVTTVFSSGEDIAFAVALQHGGKIVVAGVTNSGGPDTDFALARYNRDGSLDESFGHGGRVTTDFLGGSFASAVTLQPDGKIVAAGFAFITNVGQDFALARYNRDGSLDESFGHGGRVTTEFFGDNAAATGVAIQPNGKIVAGGGAGIIGTDKFDFVLARYLSKKAKH